MKQVLLLNIHNSKNNKSIYSCQHPLNILYSDNYKYDTYENKIHNDYGVIATFAISLNLHSSNEEVVFGAPAVQMPRGGPKYCAFEAEWENCKMAATGTVCISEDGKCGTGVEVGAPGEGSGEGGNHGAPTN